MMKCSFRERLILSVVVLFFVSCDKNAKDGKVAEETRLAPPSEEEEQPVRAAIQPTDQLAPKMQDPEPLPAEPVTVPAGKIGLQLFGNQENDPPGLIRFKLANGLPDDIETARAWVILLDAGGKMVGQKAFWLGQQEGGVTLKSMDVREFTTLVPVNGTPTKRQITFSTIQCKGGRSVHPESVLVPLGAP